MKITVTPDDGGGVDSLSDLAALIERAVAQVHADPRGVNPGAVRARVRLTLGQRVRAVELSW